MPDTKISDLPAATTPLAGTEPVPIVQGGETRQAPASAFGGQSDDYVYLSADYTLTSTTAVQKLFNTTTNGRLTLGTGIYIFEGAILLTGMGTTSGNAGFSLAGAGTATLAGVNYATSGRDVNSAVGAAGGTLSGIIHQNGSASNSVVADATASQLFFRVNGVFRCTAAGTIIPSIALTTAAAATAKTGNYFLVRRIGDSTQYTNGDWD